jgi:hypothetical protein
VRFVAHVASGNADAFNLATVSTYKPAHFPKDMEVLERGSHPPWSRAGGDPHWAIKNLCHWKDKRTIRFLVKVDLQATPGRQLCLPFSVWGRTGGAFESYSPEILRQCLRVVGSQSPRSSSRARKAQLTGQETLTIRTLHS